MIDQRMGRRVPILSPLCNVGNDPEDGSECAPGGKECWERVVDVSPAPSDPPPDVAERVADELDFLALVYRGRYGSRLIEIPQARSIAELFGECEDGENFQHRVAALADLLSRLNPHDALDEEERTDDEGNRLGSLAALERLVQRDYPETIGAVRTLRAIPAARINFPIHSRSDPTSPRSPSQPWCRLSSDGLAACLAAGADRVLDGDPRPSHRNSDFRRPRRRGVTGRRLMGCPVASANRMQLNSVHAPVHARRAHFRHTRHT